MEKLNPEKLYNLSKSPEELIQILSPHQSDFNKELFYRISGNIEKFKLRLEQKEVKINSAPYPALEERLAEIRAQFIILKKSNPDLTSEKLDLDMAKIFHQNLTLPQSAVLNYDFWRAINLFYFVDIVKWRWEKDPDNSANWNFNSRTIFGRALGVAFSQKKLDEGSIVPYTIRNRRINSYRYWWIGHRLFDNQKGYYYLDKISEKYKKEEVSAQDFLNLLEGNKLLSVQDRISKILADAILLSGKSFSEDEIRACFTRYNAYSNRLLMDANHKIIRKEICLLEV